MSNYQTFFISYSSIGKFPGDLGIRIGTCSVFQPFISIFRQCEQSFLNQDSFFNHSFLNRDLSVPLVAVYINLNELFEPFGYFSAHCVLCGPAHSELRNPSGDSNQVCVHLSNIVSFKVIYPNQVHTVTTQMDLVLCTKIEQRQT